MKFNKQQLVVTLLRNRRAILQTFFFLLALPCGRGVHCCMWPTHSKFFCVNMWHPHPCSVKDKHICTNHVGLWDLNTAAKMSKSRLPASRRAPKFGQSKGDIDVHDAAAHRGPHNNLNNYHHNPHHHHNDNNNNNHHDDHHHHHNNNNNSPQQGQTPKS